jgi:thiosulfate/3-mercaptopyruvate sulfurtransferase
VGGKKNGENGRHPLPLRSDFVNTMQNLGANDDTQIIVYDNSQATHASRVWWTLRWLGHRDVAVLDGGAQAWHAAGLEITAEKPAPRVRGNFSDRGESMPVVSYEDVLKNVSSAERLVVDARSADRFRGENETLDPIGGHIPGAINRFYRLNLRDDGTFKTAE